MSIIDSIFRDPGTRARHEQAPLREERVAFLLHMREEGKSTYQLRAMASHVLQINRTLGFKKRVLPVTEAALERVARRWAKYVGPQRRRKPAKNTYYLYLKIARHWLRYHKCLYVPPKTGPYTNRLNEFEQALQTTFGLAPETARTHQWHAFMFLRWLSASRIRLCNTSVAHVERYFAEKERKGWKLTTRRTATRSLRIFLRYASDHGWTRAGVYLGVPRYRFPKYQFAPRGPSWDEVVRLLEGLREDKPITIRDRAMISLLAIYGLRFSEAQGLLLSDIDQKAGTLTVRRAKGGGVHRFPLSPDAKKAIDEYIHHARPKCKCPNLFVTFLTPYRPLSHGAFYVRTSLALRRFGIHSAVRGPHAFRHACADHLLHQGLSVYEIAAFLGHRDLRSLRGYAQPGINDLRPVAELSLDGLQ